MATLLTSDYYHMADHADKTDLTGITLRKALKILREMYQYGEFGNLGTFWAELSDGRFLDISNAEAHGGGRIMSSQEIRIRSDIYDKGRKLTL